MPYDLHGYDYTSTTFPPVGTECYVKSTWDGTWTWVPFLVPARLTECVGPSVSEAEFTYDFGRIMRPEIGAFRYFNPLWIQGAYITCWVYDPYGAAQLWTGVIDVENVEPHGPTAYPQGRQTFHAYGVEHLLDRAEMVGSYTEIGPIKRGVRFNKQRKRGLGFSGNRSTAKAADGLSYVFSQDGELWTNLNVLEYVLARYVNTLPCHDETATSETFGGRHINTTSWGGHTVKTVQQPIGFVITGAWAALDTIVETHNLDGKTPLEAINALIPRQRGLGWRIITTGEGAVQLYIFSHLPFPVAYDDYILPANEVQYPVAFAGNRLLEPKISFNRLSVYDRVLVIGGPVYVCFSLSYADGTLTEAWTAEDTADYVAGSEIEDPTTEDHDAARAVDALRHVFQKHKIPDDFLWSIPSTEGPDPWINARPLALPNGTVTFDYAAPIWYGDKTFERELPIEEPADTPEPKYRKPFVIIEVPDPDDELEPAKWVYIEKLKTLQIEPASLDLDDQELAFWTEGSVNHTLALNHIDTDAETWDSGAEPKVDYQSIIATMCVRTDEHLYAAVRIPSQVPNEFERVKRIEDDLAELHLVLAGTVLDVSTAGDLTKQPYTAAYRDDGARLRAKAALVQAWYGFPRSTIAYSIQRISLDCPVGTMVIGTWGPEGYTSVGTVVTRRSWEFGDRNRYKTSVETGYGEFDAQ